MSEWGTWMEMREVIECSKRHCSSRAYSDTGKCATHSKPKAKRKEKKHEQA